MPRSRHGEGRGWRWREWGGRGVHMGFLKRSGRGLSLYLYECMLLRVLVGKETRVLFVSSRRQRRRRVEPSGWWYS